MKFPNSSRPIGQKVTFAMAIERNIGHYLFEMVDRQMERKGWEEPMYWDEEDSWTAHDRGYEHGDVAASVTFATPEAAKQYFDAQAAPKP